MTTRAEIIASLKYFSPSGDLGINWDMVDLNALIALDKARAEAGIPFRITSNYRTPEYSLSVGGSETDSHTENPCSAFDILCKGFLGGFNSSKAYKIIPALLNAGFNRIGIGKTHIHADMSSRLPQEVIWREN